MRGARFALLVGLSGVALACGGGGGDAPAPAASPTPAVAPREPSAASPATAPVAVASPPPFVAIRSGQSHTCALHREGRVLCWGGNSEGEATARVPSPAVPPTWVAGLDDAVAIGLGMRTSCAARRTGRVVCWGMNHSGELGIGSRGERRGLTEVRGVTSAVGIVASSESLSVCARTREGPLVCWGSMSAVEQDGRPYDDSTARPFFLPDARDVMRAGPESCALRASSEVTCWSGSQRPAPQADLTGATAIFGRSYMAFVVMSSGEVRAWATSPSPHRALAPVEGEPHPVRAALAGAVELAPVGYDLLIGRRADGSVVALGHDGRPIALEGATDLAEIVGGAELTARTRAGEIRVWRRDGARLSAPETIVIPPLEPVVAAPAGPIPEGCAVTARRASVERRATLRDVAAWVQRDEGDEGDEGDEDPLAGDADDEAIERALCGSAGLEWDAPDCPRGGPWPAVRGSELVLARRLDGGALEIVRGLAARSDGTEEASVLGRIELRSRAPIVVASLEERLERVCDDEGEGEAELCGMTSTGRFARVLVELDGGTFANVEVAITLPESEAFDLPAPIVTREGDGLRVVACGGSALVGLDR